MSNFMGTVFEVPMAKPKPHTPVAAETERRRTDPDYFIDIIGRSDFQGGYWWTCQQPDGTWKSGDAVLVNRSLILTSRKRANAAQGQRAAP